MWYRYASAQDVCALDAKIIHVANLVDHVMHDQSRILQ